MILDGKVVSKELNNTLKDQIKKTSVLFRRPKLAIILVGDNPASLKYIKGKIKAADFVGIDVELIRFSKNCEEEDVIKKIISINNNKSIDGLIVQLPLPKNFNEKKITDTIGENKDADGFTTLSKGRLFQGFPKICPATPLGIIKLLDYYKINVSGKKTVVIGRSNIVGFPLAKMLLDRNATVTICHSQTKSIKEYTKNADLIFIAIGKPDYLTSNMVKKGVVIVDVGINVGIDGKLSGDAKFSELKDISSAITPVPGGVGPMTVHALLSNTIELYKSNVKII